MKRHLHTDELLRHIVKSQGGLRTGRRISHVFVMDAPSLPDLLMVTDAAINIAPSLEEKVDIVQNAVDLAHALGNVRPKVGVLSAVELVNPKIQSTLDAAALSKMAERDQIRGAVVDGPLAMDNAISLTAAKIKGLHSLVAGRADILVVPNIEVWQHPREEPDLLRAGRGRRPRARGARAGHADEPCRRRAVAPVLLRGRGSLRALAGERRQRGHAGLDARGCAVKRQVITLNAGSSSIKFALFEVNGGEPTALAVGLAEMAGWRSANSGARQHRRDTV